MSTMGRNVKHFMSKYNVTHHEQLYMHMSVIKHNGNINVNAAYCNYANKICELVVMKKLNNEAALNKEECSAVISYLSTI